MQQTPREVHDRIFREALQYIKQHSKFPYVAYTEHLSAVSLETLLKPIDLTKYPETFGPRDDDPLVPLSVVFAALPAEDKDGRSRDALTAGPEDIEKLRWAFKLEKQAGRRDGYERIMIAQEADPYPAAMRPLEYQLAAKTLRLTPRVSGKKDRKVPSKLAQLAEKGGPYSCIRPIRVEAIKDERPDVDDALDIRTMLEPADAKKAWDCIREVNSSLRQRTTRTNLFPDDDPIWARWDAEGIGQAEPVPRPLTPPAFPRFLGHETLHPSSDMEAAKLAAAAAPVSVVEGPSPVGSAGPGVESALGGSMSWMPLQGAALDDPYDVHLLDEFGDRAFEPLTPTTKPSRSSRPSIRGNNRQEVLGRSLNTPGGKHPWDEHLWIDEPLMPMLYDSEMVPPPFQSAGIEPLAISSSGPWLGDWHPAQALVEDLSGVASNRPPPSTYCHSELAQPGEGSPAPQEQSQIYMYEGAMEHAQGGELELAQGGELELTQAGGLDLAYANTLNVPTIDDQALSPRVMSPINYGEVLAMGRTRSDDQEEIDMSWEPLPGLAYAGITSSATPTESPKRSRNAEEISMLVPNHASRLPPTPQHRVADMLRHTREEESRQGQDFIDDREFDVTNTTGHREPPKQPAAGQPPFDRSTSQVPIVAPPKDLAVSLHMSRTEPQPGILETAPIDIPTREFSPRPLEPVKVARRSSPTPKLGPAPLPVGIEAEVATDAERHQPPKKRRTAGKTPMGAHGRSLNDLVLEKKGASTRRARDPVAVIGESNDLRQFYGLKPSRPAPEPAIEEAAEVDDNKKPPSWLSSASIKNPTWYKIAAKRSLIKPKTANVLGSMRLMQDRPLLRGLAQHGLNVIERDTFLQDADLIMSPMTAVLVRNLTSFTNASQDSRQLVDSLKIAAAFFKRVIVVLCTVPYGVFDKPDIGGRSPHDVDPLTQTVVEGLGALRRKVAVGIQKDGMRIIGEVDFVFASHGAAEVGKVLRVIQDEDEDVQRKIGDGRADGMVGTRSWLEQDWSEDEGALVDEYGLNAFSALYILRQYGTLDRFADSTTPAQREHELGPVLGADVVNRLNSLLEKRLDLVRRTQKRGDFAAYSSDPISSMSDMSQQIYRRLGSPPPVQKSSHSRLRGNSSAKPATSTRRVIDFPMEY